MKAVHAERKDLRKTARRLVTIALAMLFVATVLVWIEGGQAGSEQLARGRLTGPDPPPTGAPPPRLYLPLVQRAVESIILADHAGELELVSAPLILPLTVGHLTYLPVEVLNYRRPITISAQTLIHTYINDLTAASPTQTVTLTVGVLTAPRDELVLQTLRLRPHGITLTFEPPGSRDFGGPFGARTEVTLTLVPIVQPRTPLFAIHPDTPAFNGLIMPFERVWGPDCSPCATTPGDPAGSTRDLACAKGLNDTCRCHPILEILNPEAEVRVRRNAPALQRYAFQFVRGAGGWGSTQIAPDTYLWPGLDWLFGSLSPAMRDYAPLFTGVMDGNFGWMTCPQYTNPNGSVGFFDPANRYLVEQYAAHLRAITDRYKPELRFIELSNEPAGEFYLCPCTTPGGVCNASAGPNQPACLLGPNSPQFVATYGDLLATAAISGAQALATANPDALLITGALEMATSRDHDLTQTTEYMIARGLLAYDNVAIGIHQYPYLYPNWLPQPPPSCAYFQKPGDPYWLPDGCEIAPPFDDYVTPAGKPIAARAAWQELDQRTDLTGFLRDAAVLGVLDRFYLFDTELHAGWHDGDPFTTAAREAMAGLRIAAINAHQRMLGSEFIFAPADPTAYNLMVKRLAGATPVYPPTAPLMDADYRGLVYKFFTRGNEDIIAIWSNAQLPLPVGLSTASTSFRQVMLIRFADASGQLDITTTVLNAPPPDITVQPLREFYFLSVVSDRPGFGWLKQIQR